MGRVEGAFPGENGTMPSPRPTQGISAHGIRPASPPCLIQRQSTDLVSMVYSCIGAEIEDSDGSSTCDTKPSDPDLERALTTVSDPPVDCRTNGHMGAPLQQADRQMEPGRQERIVPLTDVHSDMEEDRKSSGGIANVSRAESSQCTKPSLSVMRQRHLQESLEEAGRLELEEEHSDRKQRGTGPEGQHSITPNQTILDQSRDKSSSEMSSSKSSPGSPCEDTVPEHRNLSYLQEERVESRSPPAPERVSPGVIQEEGEGHSGNPIPFHLTRKSNSFDIGIEQDRPYDLQRSSDLRFPVKKPCLPQYRNRSLDYPPGPRCYDSPQHSDAL
ncbi:hypothetical protein NL108_003319 [Boleophthalmus pectinirostris]|nr:hypothetical protein NL108_003319 [Boleophthalmus pectinirostris]